MFFTLTLGDSYFPFLAYSCFPITYVVYMVVFPMHVGVFLRQNDSGQWRHRLPHARGGVSNSRCATSSSHKSSPCTWGCFQSHSIIHSSKRVFPMHVGVFLPIGDITPEKARLPHARGGVSILCVLISEHNMSSPCTWGCFGMLCYNTSINKVFPMHVGVFPCAPAFVVPNPSLPHARGGVSVKPIGTNTAGTSSPCTWGCFYLPKHRQVPVLVFPMHVGVFPVQGLCQRSRSSLPHARGGVSENVSMKSSPLMSSPCTWGCFSSLFRHFVNLPVFPMHVGVFLVGV